MALNRLARGVDPYADVRETNVRSGHVFSKIDATKWAAGGNVYVSAPCDGRVRELETVVQVANSANACVVGATANGTSLGTLTVASAAAAGTRNAVRFLDDSADKNKVKKGDVITIAFDGAPSAGEVDVAVWVDACDGGS